MSQEEHAIPNEGSNLDSPQILSQKVSSLRNQDKEYLAAMPYPPELSVQKLAGDSWETKEKSKINKQ